MVDDARDELRWQVVVVDSCGIVVADCGSSFSFGIVVADCGSFADLSIETWVAGTVDLCQLCVLDFLLSCLPYFLHFILSFITDFCFH